MSKESVTERVVDSPGGVRSTRAESARVASVSIDTTFLRRCIASLERAVEGIEGQEDREHIMYDIYRAASVKEFGLVLEQGGKLLRKRLAAWFASNRQADRLHVSARHRRVLEALLREHLPDVEV